jgi:hypothetical protein
MPAYAQGEGAEIRLLQQDVAALQAERTLFKAETKARFGTEDINDVVEKLQADLAAARNDIEALRQEVRALSSKPGETPTLTLRAPFSVTDAAGRELFRVGDGDEGTRIASTLAVTNNDRPILAMSSEGLTVTNTFTLNTVAGKPAAALLATAGRATSLTLLADDGGGGVSLGVVNSGSGFLELSEPSGVTSVRIGAIESNKMGLRVMQGSTVQASIGLDDANKGIVRVGDPTGPRGVLGATRSGGVSFALYNDAGTDYRVGMLAAPDNSFVRLNGQGNAVHLNADGEGSAVHVFNKLGNAAVSAISSPSGHGQLTLGNAEGDTIVQAGMTVDGLGVVRAGPMMGGAGTGGLQGVPFAILGKKER